MPGDLQESSGGGGTNADEANAAAPPSSDHGVLQPPADTATNRSSSFSTNTQRTHSALHNRLLNQQRSNMLLQVLFHHMLNSRRRREEEVARAQSPPPLPDREMPVLSSDDAEIANAICRFCFEGSSTSDNSLVAPCNCAGGSRWVHLECLRQWQRQQVRNLGEDQTATYSAAGYTCNVCNSPYLIRPPAVRSVRRSLLKRGTLLVSRPSVGRTFQRTVVLLLSNISESPFGVFGLIINSPLQEESTPNNLLLQQEEANVQEGDDSEGNNNAVSTNNLSIEWRRGGPVCGGRLGVVHYSVLHTFPPSIEAGLADVDIDEEYFDDDEAHDTANENEIDLEAPPTDDAEEDPDIEAEDEGDDIDDDDDLEVGEGESESCAPLSLPVFDALRNSPPLHFVATPHTSVPTTFSEDSLRQTIQRLAQGDRTDSNAPTETNAETEIDQGDNDSSESTNEPRKVILFSGYCKWRSGQLEREIQREVWDVCIDATPEDILRQDGSHFWEELSQSDRLLSWQRLLEEGEAGVED